jgi:endonuclease III
VCKAQRPLCELCNLSDICLYRKGIDKWKKD